LGDTLLSEFTADEIETVLAHELGHHVNRDIPLAIAFKTVSATLGRRSVRLPGRERYRRPAALLAGDDAVRAGDYAAFQRLLPLEKRIWVVHKFQAVCEE
jgi:Zn-dependent protease with chaperone function